MISIRKYLDGVPAGLVIEQRAQMPEPEKDLLAAVLTGYCRALVDMGRFGAEVCPALGEELQQNLGSVAAELGRVEDEELLREADQRSHGVLEDWGRRGARHYQKKAGEVKDILLVMARMAESVGDRDQRCAQQLNDVTAQLRGIADLEDLTEIRASIEKSAGELKTSIERMTAEGKAALEQLRSEVSTYQAKMEAAEQIATRDALTRLGSRLWAENQLEVRVAAGVPFCAAILDIDGFKRVNDEHGHVVGDELLRQFATELRSACRATDVIGRWGGDEFLVLLDCPRVEAEAQMDRVNKWVCGSYTVEANGAEIKLRVDASIGVAEYAPEETTKQLLERADREMYRQKARVRERT